MNNMGSIDNGLMTVMVVMVLRMRRTTMTIMITMEMMICSDDGRDDGDGAHGDGEDEGWKYTTTRIMTLMLFFMVLMTMMWA